MKVTSFKSFVVGTPPPGHGGRYFIFVKLTTACGIDGYGEIYAGHIAPDIICQIAQDSFERHLYNNQFSRLRPLCIKCMAQAFCTA